MELLGGRKFVFALVMLIASFALVLVGDLPAIDWVKFAEVIGGIFVIGNVSTKAIK